MVESVSVSLVNCAGREAIIGERFFGSANHNVKLNVFGAFRNPMLYNLTEKSGGNYYIVDVNDERNLPDIVEKCKNSDIVFIGNETPIIKNLGGMLRRKYGEDVGVIAPNSEFALEKSKYETRLIIDEVCPETNPEYYFIEPKKIGWERDVKKAVNALNGKVAIKPIEPKYGTGVIVEGFDFASEEAYQKAIESAKAGSFLIEEKIIGREWSGQYAVDSKLHVEPFPAVLDFKRADEKGPNTGGVACVKGEENILPFMKKREFDEGARIAKKIKRKLTKRTDMKTAPRPEYYTRLICWTGEETVSSSLTTGSATARLLQFFRC
jgi:phosphoribosylamine-glycine ligase